MAEYVRHPNMPDRYRVICTSDWHVGSRAFHEAAALGIVARLRDESDTYMIFGGDAIEGKTIDSPHFDPAGLDRKRLVIKEQLDWWCALLKPVASKVLAIGAGNHDIYMSRDFDTVAYAAEKIGAPLGGYQTWLDLAGLRVHVYHGRRSMPRGAKDPIQRDANQRAWLANMLAPLAGDCHVHLTGHVHALLVQPPVEQYALLSTGPNVRSHYFTEPVARFEGEHGAVEYVPPLARWYACTGTLRRSGGFGWNDYAEIAGYPPSPIGYVEMEVEAARVVTMRKVIV